MGVPDGWSPLLVRTESGLQAGSFAQASDLCKCGDASPAGPQYVLMPQTCPPIRACNRLRAELRGPGECVIRTIRGKFAHFRILQIAGRTQLVYVCARA